MTGRIVSSGAAVGALLPLVAFLVSGCATPDAVEPRGRWTPIPQYAEQPRAIPLQQAYLYRALPADGTLHALLTRWAKDTQLRLAYQHADDYTLHAPVARLQTPSIAEAVDALSNAYAAQGIRISVESGQIVVRPSASAAPVAVDHVPAHPRG